MGQIKATTITQRFGFSDTDLKTPMHDEIMLWLDAVIGERLVKKFTRDWTQKEIECAVNSSFYYSSSTPRISDLSPVPERPLPSISRKVWEFPISSGNYVIGFVDLRVEVCLPSLQYLKFPGQEEKTWHISSDLTAETFNFEVKTSIPSLGELIRQIRMYQEYDKRANYVVVAPPNQFVEALKNQGIGFIKYNPE